MKRVGAADCAADAAGIGAVEPLEPRRLLALVEWDGGAGTDSWHDALNWSGDAVPTEVDDVVIGETELPAIQLDGLTHIGSLTTAENLVVRGGLFASSHVQLDACLKLGDGATTGSLGFSPGVDGFITGSGEIIFDYAGAGSGSAVLVSGWNGTLSIGEDVRIRGGGGSVTAQRLHLLGSVHADVPGLRIQLSGPYTQTSVTVGGLLESAGGTLELHGESISFDGGWITNSGGVFELKGIVQNTGRVFTLPPDSGDVFITWGGFVGGTVRSEGSGGLRVDGTRGSSVVAGFDDVHLDAPLWVYNNAEVRVLNGLTLESSLTLGRGASGASFGRLVFWILTPEQVLAGSGEIVFDYLGGSRPEMVSNYVSAAQGVQLTIDEGITFRGRGGMIRAEQNAVITTSATISSDAAGYVYLGQSGQIGMIFNYGRLNASNGGILDVGPYNGARVTLGEGTSFTADAGRLRVRGVDIDAGETLFFDAESGTLELSHTTFVGNHFASRGGTVAFGEQTVLDGVTLDVSSEIVGATQVKNGVTLNAAMAFVYVPSSSPSGGLQFVDTPLQLLEGTATITFSDVLSSPNDIMVGNGVALTIAAGISIRGGPGNVRTLAGGSIIHLGSLEAATAGRTIYLVGDVTHHGVMQIAAGARIARTGAWVMQEGASLQIEIAGTANNQMGRLTATGSVTVNGAAEVSYVNGFVPQRGQSFRFVSSVGALGGFDTITTPPLSDPDLKSPVLIDSQGLRLIVTHIADFDNDLTVDVDDIFAFLTAWFAGDGDFDEDGANSVPDIFVFLSAWYRA